MGHLSVSSIQSNWVLEIEQSMFSFFSPYNLYIFGCPWSSLLHVVFPSCREWGLLSGCGARGSGCSQWLLLWTQALGAGSVVMAQRLSCSAVLGIFLDQGYEPVSPALAVRFLSTVPSGKSPEYVSFSHSFQGYA